MTRSSPGREVIPGAIPLDGAGLQRRLALGAKPRGCSVKPLTLPARQPSQALSAGLGLARDRRLVGALLRVLHGAVIAAFNASYSLPIQGESPGSPNVNSGARYHEHLSLIARHACGPGRACQSSPSCDGTALGGWNSATRPLLIGRENMNHTMGATSQDEFGGPEVLKCLGDPLLVSPRVPNPRERSACGAHGPRVGRRSRGSDPFSRFPERST